MSIFVDGEWFHRVELPFVGHPRNTKERYSLISHLIETWDDDLLCWCDDWGGCDYCSDLRAMWQPTEDEWGGVDPLFWTRLMTRWSCPSSWRTRSYYAENLYTLEYPDPPEWVVRCEGEIPPSFRYELLGLKRRERKASPEDRAAAIAWF